MMRTLDVISALSALGGLPSLVNTVKRCARFAIAWLRRMEKKGKRPPRAVVDPRTALHELRLHKRPEELACLREACAISERAA